MKAAPLAEDPAARRALVERIAALAIPPEKGVREGAEKYMGRDYPFAKNPREYRGVRLEAANGGWTLKFNARAGEMAMLLGFGEWKRSELRVDPEQDEGLAKIVGMRPVVASAAVQTDGSFKAVVRLLDAPQRIEFVFAEKHDTLTVDGAVIGIGGSKFTGTAR